MLAIADVEREPNTPGWTVRVVPNLYPVLDRHEVVIHSPRHVRTFAELEDSELDAVATAWVQRMQTAQRRDFGRGNRGRYVHAFINEGRAAGASLAHSHSQLVWLPHTPPVIEVEQARESGVQEAMSHAGLEVSSSDGLVAVVHPAGRVPYETLIAGREPGAFPFVQALLLLRDVVRRLRAVEGAVPWNAWLHGTSRPHIEVVPRLTLFAGIELGAGVYVNTLPPEEAALRLREA